MNVRRAVFAVVLGCLGCGIAAGTPPDDNLLAALGRGAGFVVDAGPEFPLHKEPLTGITFTAEGRLVAAVGLDGRLTISDAATGALKHDLVVAGADLSAEVAVRLAGERNGSLLAVGVPGAIQLYDAESGRAKQRLALPAARFDQLGFTTAGDRLVSLDDKRVVVWSMPAGEKLLTFELASRAGRGFALSPDDRTLICGATDRRLDLFDLTTGKLQRSIANEGQGHLRCFAVDAQGTFLAVGNSNGTNIHDFKTGALRSSIPYAGLYTAFTPTGVLAIGYYDIDFFNVVRKDPRPIAKARVHGGEVVEQIEFTLDGGALAVANGAARHAQTFTLGRTLETQTTYLSDKPLVIDNTAVSPDGKWLAWREGRTLTLFSIADAKVTGTTEIPEDDIEKVNLEFAPDSGELMACIIRKTYTGDPVLRYYSLPDLGWKWKARPPSKQNVEFVCYAPDGKQVILLTHAGSSRLMDRETGRIVEKEIPFLGLVMRVARGKEDRYVVANHFQMNSYAGASFKPVAQWHAGQEVWNFVISPDATYVALHRRHEPRVVVWNATTGKMATELQAGTKGVLAAGFSSDGKWLITCGEEGRMQIRSCDDWELRGSTNWGRGSIVDLQFVRGSAEFLTFHSGHAGEGGVKRWNLDDLLRRIPATAKPTKAEPFTAAVPFAELRGASGPGGYTAGGKQLYTFDGSTIRLFDRGKTEPRWEFPIGPARWATFSPDGRRLAASFGDDHRYTPENVRPPATVKIWDVDTRRIHKELNLGSRIVERIDFSPDGRTLAVADSVGVDVVGQLSLWDVETGTLRAKLPIREERITHVKFSPDGKLLAFAGRGEFVALWDLEAGKLRFRKPLAHRPEDLQFSADGKWLAACGERFRAGSIAVLDVATGDRLPWFGDFNDLIAAFAFSPRGDLCVTVSKRETAVVSYRLWSLPELKEIRRIDVEANYLGDSVVQFSPDGAELFQNVTVDPCVWRVEDILDLTLQRELQALKQRGLYVSYSDGLPRVSFGYEAASDQGLQGLPVLSRPFTLALAGGGLTNDGLAHLAKQKNLVGVYFERCEKLTPAGLMHLNGLPLKILRTEYLRAFTDDDIGAIGALTGLETLQFEPDSRGEVLDFGPLAKLKNLRELTILGNLRPDQLRYFAGLTKLEVLSFGWGCGDDDFRHLAALDQLRELRIYEADITGAGLAHLSPRAELEVLLLKACGKFDDAGLAHVSRFKRLRELDLDRTAVTSKGLAAIAGLTLLEKLELPKHVDDAGLAHLADLTRVRKLDLYGRSVSDEGLKHLAKWTELEEFNIGNCPQVNGRGLAVLAGAPRVKYLRLQELKSLTDDGMVGLEPLVQLERLGLPQRITDAGLKHLGPLVNLKELVIDKAKLTEAGLAHLTKLAALQSLELNGVRLTEAAIPTLAKIPKLYYLNLARTGLTAESVKRLKEAVGGRPLQVHEK